MPTDRASLREPMAKAQLCDTWKSWACAVRAHDIELTDVLSPMWQSARSTAANGTCCFTLFPWSRSVDLPSLPRRREARDLVVDKTRAQSGSYTAELVGGMDNEL
jgi:hypothetical protein